MAESFDDLSGRNWHLKQNYEAQKNEELIGKRIRLAKVIMSTFRLSREASLILIFSAMLVICKLSEEGTCINGVSFSSTC